MCSLWFHLLVCVTLIQLGTGNEELTLKYTHREEQPPGTFVGNIARDSELYSSYTPEDFQKLKYALFTQASEIAGKFTIDESSSTIRTAEKLDREAECEGKEVCILSIDVEVFMTNSETNIDDLKKIIRVHITLEDINDNAPTFPKGDVVLSVPESVSLNQVLLISAAVDLDTGNNSVQSYDIIQSGGMFGLKVTKSNFGTADLGIEVLHALDRETQDVFQMTVIAKDGGFPQRSGSVTVYVQVTDVNDNKPIFTKRSFNATVPEDAPIGNAIITLSANDPDSEKNGKLAYHFSARAPESVRKVLAINEDSGEIYPIRRLDYEDKKEYVFLVEVNDLGTPTLSSQATVSIEVSDVNDNAPQIVINLPPSGKDISEDTEVGTFIAHVSVFDIDSGRNGEFACEIKDDHFKLEKFSTFEYYKILLQKPLDYEESRTRTVNVTCTDKGIIPRSSSSSFTVTVEDINDNAPVFPKSRIVANIRENNRYSDRITTLSARDPDGPGNNKVIYSIIEDRDDMVNLDPSSGEVRANKVYDRETVPSFEVQVLAQDASNSNLISTAVLVVFVDDDNDNPPKFTLPHFSFYVSERIQVGHFVGKLNATDQDANQTFAFFFQYDTNASKYFSIDRQTGVVRNKRKLDRENHRTYNFGVIVRDPSKYVFMDTANVTVYLRDWNDNRPTIIFPSDSNNTVYVPYSLAVGTVVLTIDAYDNDTEDNAKITYTIEQGNEKELFFLNMMSGEMLIAKEIRITDAGTYKLVVAAHDSGSPQLTSFANLNIIITTANGTITTIPDSDANQYIAIVITLVCVTAVLCVAVIITICIIKKIDKERRQTLKEKMQTQNANANAYNPGTVETVEKGVSPNKPYDNEIEKLKKKIKRELSFNVDDSAPLDTTEVTGASFATFKNMTSYSSIDQKTLAVKKADDVTSELSQGAETDSGRGCSEEDSQSNRGSAVPHSDSAIVRHASYV